MNEDKILRQNKIPGCERLTRPEEIAALSKYLKKIKETYDEHTELERDKLEIPGKTTGQLKEVKDLGTNSIKLKKNKDPEGLSEYIEKLTDSNKISLNNSSAKLNVNEEIKTLNNNLEKLAVSDEVGLNNSRENLKIDDNIELADGLITLDSKTEIELSDERINLNTDKDKIELETKSIELEDKREVDLNNVYEKLEDNRKNIELNNKKEGLLDYRKDIDLSDYRENFTDDRKEKLADKKEVISDRRQETLSSYKDSFLDDRKINLNNKKENLSPSPDEVKNLSDYRENFTDDRDINLEDEVIKLNNISDLPLSDFKDILVNGDFKEVGLENEVTNLVSNDSESNNFIDPNDATLEDEVINLVSNDSESNNFIDPNDATLEDEIISRPSNSSSDARDTGVHTYWNENGELEDEVIKLGPENPNSDAGDSHNFIDPNDATLEDGIITLIPNDSESNNFIDPNDATLEDGVINIIPNDSESNNFIDPNDATLEDEVINLVSNDSESNNFIDPNDAELEDEVVNRPSNSSSDARDTGVHTYWNEGGELEDEKIILTPNLDDEAGEGHSFMDPNNATLSDKILELGPEDPQDDAGNNHNFIDPNNATLEDEVVNIIPNDFESNNFIDHNNAELEDEVINRPIFNPNSDARLLDSEYQYVIDGDIGNTAPDTVYDRIRSKEKKILRPDISSEDATYDGSSYDYISNTDPYITDWNKIDEHKKKLNRPQVSEIDARIDELYKYKDNLTDSELYEEVIKLLESIGNDHEYDNISSTSENFHKMTGTVGSASWIQKLESLVSAYLSGNNKVSPTNAHMFEDALYSSFIPEARYDSEYNFIDNNTTSEQAYSTHKQKVENTRKKVERPINNPESDARDGDSSDYNYWDKENPNNQLKYTDNSKIPVEGLENGLFSQGSQETPADRFKRLDNENYEVNQARVGVPDYVLSDLLVDSIQNGSYTNFNLGNTDSYLNFLKSVGNSDISVSRYIRWAAEQACKLNPGGSTTRKLLLEETLAALVFARDYVERLTGSNRDRLPGDEKWYSTLLSGGVGEFVQQGINHGRDWLYGKLGIINDPKKQEPLNRPKPERSSIDLNFPLIDADPLNITQQNDYLFTDKYQAEVSRRPDIQGNISTELKFSESYLGGFGLFTTLKDLCESSRTKIHSLYDLKAALKDAPYITTPDKFGSIRKNGESKFGSYSLDTNAYWEIILEPLCYKPLNGGISFLPSIQEINVMNKLQHGVLTAYNKWIPFTSFDLQKSKMVGKSLSLFDGEINYPSSVELTNELRLTIVDDEFKSWRQYFQKCMDVSVYNSTSHDWKFYNKSKDELLRNLEELTIVDKDYICISFYKNIAFNIQIYLMNPQYSTIRSYNLLCVLKDFSEDYSGDTDGGAQDLNLTFSVVGELRDYITTAADSNNLTPTLPPLPGNNNFPDQVGGFNYINYIDPGSIVDPTYPPSLSDLGFVGWT